MQIIIPAYVYLVKHTPTGKFYYGSRYKHIEYNLTPEEDLWKKYFTSSKEIKSLLKESSTVEFETEILFTSNDHDLCFDYEQDIIRKNIKNTLCLNKRYFDSLKGSRVFRTYGKTLSSKGKSKSDKTKLRISKQKMVQILIMWVFWQRRIYITKSVLRKQNLSPQITDPILKVNYFLSRMLLWRKLI